MSVRFAFAAELCPIQELNTNLHLQKHIKKKISEKKKKKAPLNYPASPPYCFFSLKLPYLWSKTSTMLVYLLKKKKL